MRRFLLYCAALLLFIPHGVFAETQSANSATAKGYCPDTSKIFKGSIYHTDDGKPWVEIKVDSDFQAKMTKERSLGILPLTPVYDLVVRIKPEFEYYCIPGWAGSGREATSGDLPTTVPIKGSLVFGPKDESVVSSAVFSRTDVKDEQGRFVYEWKIKGWQNGIASENKMERLIAAIANGQSPSVTLAMTQSDGMKTSERGGAPLGLCAPVWGSGAHRAVYDRVAHRLSDFIYQADSVVQGGFLQIDPFKAYQKEFSHVLNLRNYQGKKWSKMLDLAKAGTLPLFSDCGTGIQITISPLVGAGDFAAAMAGGKFIYAASDVERRITRLNVQLKKTATPLLFEIPFPLIVLHEFGHEFAGLADEYLKARGFYLDSWNGRNCRSVPEWTIGVKRYGDRNYEECSSDKLNRPSKKSLMNGAVSGSTFFNVVSCGYIVAAIKGGDGPEYWQECMNPAWNTIKPAGTSASVELYFASVAQAFTRLFDASQFLGAVDSALSGAKDGPSIKVEYFSEDGTITGDEYPLLHTADMSADLVAPPEADDITAISTDVISAMSTTEPYVGKAASGAEMTAMPATPAFQNGDKVKITVPTPPAPPAEFEPLQQGEQVNGPEQCLDATGKQSFSQNPSPFRAQWGQEALCSQNVARATTLSQTIAGLERSSATLQMYIDALSASAEEVNTLISLNDVAVSIIPTGEDSSIPIGEVKSVGLQCVAGVSAPVGTAALSKIRAYLADSPTIGKEVQAAKQKITERYTAFRKEPEKSKGTVTGATLDRLSDLKALLKNSFVMVTAASSVKLNARAPANTIPLSATFVRDANGAAKQCTSFAWGVKTKLLIGGVKGDFVVGNVTFDGRTFEQDCIPEAFLLGEFKAGLARNLAYYQAKKAEYEALLPPLKRELASLESTGYSCRGSKTSPVAKKNVIPSPSVLDEDATTSTASTTGVLGSLWNGIVSLVGKTVDSILPVRKSIPAAFPTVISSCGEITEPGKYVLEHDLTAAVGACLSIHDTANVDIDCQNYIIAGSSAVSFLRVQDFRIHSCNLQPQNQGFSLSIENSSQGEISDNKIGPGAMHVPGGSNLKITRNNFTGPYQQYYTNESRIEQNLFDFHETKMEAKSGAVILSVGTGNVVVHNTIDGASDGVYLGVSTPGTDDGIVANHESHALIEDNIIRNVWDCGIETTGLLLDSVIRNNNITNVGICGIGGWYGNSWKGNLVLNNTVDDTSEIFHFYRSDALSPPYVDADGRSFPGDGPIYFKDNTFESNTLINSHQKGTFPHFRSALIDMEPRDISPRPKTNQRPVTKSDFILGNNIFKDNDFTRENDAPLFRLTSMIVDGGGNICKPPTDPSTYPLKCNNASTDSNAGGMTNLTASKPLIFGTPTAEPGQLFAGEMTLRAKVTRTGSNTIPAFKNVWQYAEGESGTFQDWISFDIPGLTEGQNADVSYSWHGGVGKWRFRVCVDSGNAIAEEDERDNCSVPVAVEIVPALGGKKTPVPVGGTAKIVPGRPAISGTDAGSGKILAGTMTFSAVMSNSGDGASGSFRSQLQYSRDDAQWNDWVSVDLPPLGPGNTSTVRYSWSGGAGVWYFRECEDIGNTCSASTRTEIVSR